MPHPGRPWLKDQRSGQTCLFEETYEPVVQSALIEKIGAYSKPICPELINGLRKDLARSGGVVEMSKWFHKFSFDVRVAHYNAHHGRWGLVSGGRFSGRDSNEPHWFIKSIHGTFAYINIVVPLGACVDFSSQGWHRFCKLCPHLRV